MNSPAGETSNIGDHRWLHLLGWEARLLGWGRHFALRVTVIVAITAAAFPLLWRLAAEPEPYIDFSRAFALQFWGVVTLIVLPLRGEVATVGQMGFVGAFLCYATYLAILIAKLVLPGIAAGSVAGDRRTGRLGDLRATTFSAGSIFAAKTLASAGPFLLAGLTPFAAMLPAAIAAYTPAADIMPLLVELFDQVILITTVSVACSCLCRSAAIARVEAYIVVWVALPFTWAAAATLCGIPALKIIRAGAYSDVGLAYYYGLYPFGRVWSFHTLFWGQMVLSLVWIAAAALVGARRLFPRE